MRGWEALFLFPLRHQDTQKVDVEQTTRVLLVVAGSDGDVE